MHSVPARALGPAACAGGPGGSLAGGGQQPGRSVQPPAPAACHGGQLCRCGQQSRGQESPVAGLVATKDPELVNRGGAEFADSPAPPSYRTGPGGGGRPGGGRRPRRDSQSSWAESMLPGVFGRQLARFCRSESQTALGFVIPARAAITTRQLALGMKRLGQQALLVHSSAGFTKLPMSPDQGLTAL